MALTFLTTGNIWAEEIPKDTIKVVDVEEILIIASPKENRKLRELPTALSCHNRTCRQTK